MTDADIIRALIDRDERVTRRFFFKDCRPLFSSIIRNVFSYDVDYDEFVNEFYVYLMENDAYRLRQFEGRSTIFFWLKTVAIRYFLAKRDRMIDMESDEALSRNEVRNVQGENFQKIYRKMTVDQLLELMDNPRQVYVLRRLILDDAEPKKVAQELQVTVDNLYNIKKRAIDAITQIALNEADRYGKIQR